MRGLGPVWGPTLKPGAENSAPAHPPETTRQGQQPPQLTVGYRKMSVMHLHSPLLGPPGPHTLLSGFASGWNYVTHILSQLPVQIRSLEGQLSMSLINKEWEIN